MHILVCVPGVSYTAFQKSKLLVDPLVSGPFEPTGRNLEVFQTELADIQVPYMWGVNIPHWPMEAHGTKGVAGPGRPQDELFYPPSMAEPFGRIAGNYDKWRPYPAHTLSKYSVQMAKRLAKKRCRMFDYVVTREEGHCLLYVEHSPASVAHLSAKTGLSIADVVFERVLRTGRRRPSWPMLIFSPYGVGKRPGFFVSNGVGKIATEGIETANWDVVRAFIEESTQK